MDNAQSDLSWTLQSDQFADYGEFVLNSETGEWTFNLFNDSAVVQALQESSTPVTLEYTVRVSDGLGGFSDTTVTITVTGTNDRPLVANGPQVGSVDEAGIDASNNDIPGVPSVSGDLNATDVDNAQIGGIQIATDTGDAWDVIVAGIDARFIDGAFLWAVGDQWSIVGASNRDGDRGVTETTQSITDAYRVL